MNAEQVFEAAEREAKIIHALRPILEFMNNDPIQAAKTFTMAMDKYNRYQIALNKIGNLTESQAWEAKTIAREVLGEVYD